MSAVGAIFFFLFFFAFLSFFFRFVEREPADAEQKYFSGDAACRLLKSGCRPTAKLKQGYEATDVRPNQSSKEVRLGADNMPDLMPGGASESKGQKAQVWKQVELNNRRRSKSHASCPNKRQKKSRVASKKKKSWNGHGKTCGLGPFLTPSESSRGRASYQVMKTR